MTTDPAHISSVWNQFYDSLLAYQCVRSPENARAVAELASENHEMLSAAFAALEGRAARMDAKP